MRIKRIKDPYTNGYITLGEIDDFEYVNPIHNIISTIKASAKMFVNNGASLLQEHNILPNKIDNLEEFINKIAEDDCDAYFESVLTQSLPENLLKILESSSKNKQKSLLKGISITSHQLMFLIIKAWEDYGFTYSFYTSKHNHNGINDSDMPAFSMIEEDGEVIKVGETHLTDGEIKHAIDFKTLRIAKFIDKDEKWHCFFYDLKSISGKEKGWEGKPHIHYISSSWGFTREQVLFQLKSKNYKLPSLPHINFSRTEIKYRN